MLEALLPYLIGAVGVVIARRFNVPIPYLDPSPPAKDDKKSGPLRDILDDLLHRILQKKFGLDGDKPADKPVSDEAQKMALLERLLDQAVAEEKK